MIQKHLIINKSDSEVRIALLENNRVAELLIERESEKNIIGNIYKGIVTRVMPGMNAAFINIGLEKSAFLYGGDAYSSKQSNKRITPHNHPETEKKEFNQIGDRLEDGQRVLVQVTKEPISTKGPRVTMHPTIAGRFLVIVPYSLQVSLSRKIENEEEKTRLTTVLEKLVASNKIGIIARTASQNITKETIIRDFNLLKKNWEQIKQKAMSQSPKTLVHSELDLIKKSIRDFFDEGVRSIFVDDFSTYHQQPPFQHTHHQ